MADGMMRILLTLFLALNSVAATAEDLPDPTRPPSFIAGTGTASGLGATSSRTSGLQSTIISESHRAAIIDGKTVNLWEKHGKSQLIEVNEGSVVLRTEQKLRKLSLFPDVKLTQSETNTEKASPESGAQPDEVNTIPAAQHEKNLSGHPKEKK